MNEAIVQDRDLGERIVDEWILILSLTILYHRVTR